jgi:hypothetical protein
MTIERFSQAPVMAVMGEAPPLTEGLRRRVDEIWDAALARSDPPIFDGELLGVRSRDGSRWQLETGSYKRFLCGLRDPSLAEEIAFFPVGVTGLIHCRDGYIVGKRASGLAQDAGKLEFVPAGGMVSDDVIGGHAEPIHALAREWNEETGDAPFRPLSGPEVIGYTFDSETGVYDLIIGAELDLTQAELDHCHRNGKNREYSEIFAMPFAESFALRSRMAKTSREILDWLSAQSGD